MPTAAWPSSTTRMPTRMIPWPQKKMQEINAAYEQIKNPEKQTGSAYGGGTAGQGAGGYQDPFADIFRQWQAQQRQQQQARFHTNEAQAAYNYIQNGRFQEALNALEQVTPGLRDGQWHYLSALVHDGMGNSVMALEHIRQAVAREPDNLQYRQVLQQLEQGGSFYRRQAGSFQGFGGIGDLCLPVCMCYGLNWCCCPRY